jgi:hypothetical protein
MRWLNLFRTSEIFGSEVLIRMLPLARENATAVDLHQHIHEEAGHARMWARIIADLGGQLQPERSYQRYMQKHSPAPRGLSDLLALNIVTERRAARNYFVFATLPDLPSQVRKALAHIIDDERWHIDWQVEWLTQIQCGRGGESPDELMDRFRPHDLAATKEVILQFQDPTLRQETIDEYCQPV